MIPGAASAARAPRLGFLGVGWIGRNRMEAVLSSGLGLSCVLCDPSSEMIAAARELAPAADVVDSFEQLLAAEPDGILIATPSALHAEQSMAALNAGIAVFCQKPLGRNAGEVAAVLEAARRRDRLLGADFSYRHTRATRLIRDLIQDGAIGRVYTADLVFHNAYGPDKPWFYDPALSGGGCVMDLGVHLVDLLLWMQDFPEAISVAADLFAAGQRLENRHSQVEDYAVVTLGLDTGAVARLACSWRLHAGCDAVISATFHGTKGSLAFQNAAGSFYDFTAELRRGTHCEVIASPPDHWGGRAAVDWAGRLAAGHGFDPAAEQFLRVSQVLDSIYENAL
ncbi:oxidoreductase [Labrys okinawensis]|uniref:Oxidoreductase n=1 Tax=Labrys okinawensis TaxID=346911 RepID=A0A2S9QIF8_9HYPH|nr:Gfo/Idh/MocA family oxidoreductase [Labrys okinawensis]PRH89070.1 oxidoreductase [Labrys okinawensis]